MSSGREVEIESASDPQEESKSLGWKIVAMAFLPIVLLWEILTLPAKIYRWFQEDPAKRALRRWTKRSS